MNVNTAYLETVAFLQGLPELKGFTPKVGMILGSGLGGLADSIESLVKIPFSNIPGFYSGQAVIGHASQLIVGYLNGVPVICMQGRIHHYEGAAVADIATPIRAMKKMGAESIVITNATGSLRKEVGPGELVVVTDHINMNSDSPLLGPNDDTLGPRFVPMENAYEPSYQSLFHDIAKDMGVTLHEGVYFWVKGPTYETAAEIRAFRLLGGDIIGMSTVPEVIAARHCGLKVVALSVVTNFGTGISDEPVDHDAVVHHAKAAGVKLSEMISKGITQL